MSNMPTREQPIADITVEEIMAMEAGPELDYLVARCMPGDVILYPELVQPPDDGVPIYVPPHVECEWLRRSPDAEVTGAPDYTETGTFNPSQDANDALVVWRALPLTDAEDIPVVWVHRRTWGDAGEDSEDCISCEHEDLDSGGICFPVEVYDDFCPAVCKAYLLAVKEWGVGKTSI